MKTAITRLFTYCVIGTSVLLTSCVSEDISPHVEELRSAQTDYLQAQAALEQAKAQTEAAQAALLQTQAQIAQAESDARIAMMAAETTLMEAQVAFEEALMEAKTASEIARLESEVAQAQYEKDLLEAKLAAEKAELEAMIAQAQVNAAQAQLALQEAVDALVGQINETAQGYLGLYQNTMEQANNKLEQITILKSVVAKYEANLDVNGNVLDFDKVTLELEGAISEDLAKIESIQEAIIRLEGLNANADDVREEFAQVINNIEELEKVKDDANLELDRAFNDLAPFDNKYNELINSINNIDNLMGGIAYFEERIAILTPELEEVKDRLDPYQVDLTEVEDQLTSEIEKLQAYLDTAEDAFYNYEYVRLNGTPAEVQDALDTYNAAINAIIDYTGAWYGWNNTQYYVWYPNPNTDFGDAVLAVSDIEDYPTYNNLLNTFNNVNFELVNAQNELMWRESNLEYWQNIQDDILSFVGVASVEEFWSARNEVYVEINEKSTAINKIQDELNVLWDLRWKLYYYLNDPNRPVAQFENQIADFQDQIENLEANIAANQELLVQNTFEAEEMAAMIARTQERIDRLMTEYDALVALANEYLEKFNEILENN